MDLSGRFNFWRVLLHTRAITPPRVPAGLWPKLLRLRRVWWVLFFLGAGLGGRGGGSFRQRALGRQSSAPVPPPTHLPRCAGRTPPAWGRGRRYLEPSLR